MQQLIQSFPAAATIVAALITGFGAAALKQRWDVANDRARWAREFGERARKERLDAFSSYIAARPSLAKMRQIVAGSARGELIDFDSIIGAFRIEAARLLILLGELNSREIIETDLGDVETWVLDAAENIHLLSRYPEVVTPERILNLARELRSEVVVDPGMRSPRRNRLRLPR